MTIRSDYHTSVANEFLPEARAYLAQGDLLQASEKGWGATARMVKAVADTRGWRHRSHRDLHDAVDRLVEESSAPRLLNLFRAASALHQNFYEGWMTEEDVAVGLEAVEEIVDRLRAATD